MKHTKVVIPTDPSEIAPPILPDRSDLSKLYLRSDRDLLNAPQNETTADQPSATTKHSSRISLEQGLVSLLLTIPLVATYLAAVFIYQGSDAHARTPDPLFPLLSFFVSAVWFVSCLVSLRTLRKRFYMYNTSLSGFVAVYSFYLLPLLKLTYDLFPTNYLGLLSTVLLWLVANRLIVWYIVWSLSRDVASNRNKAVVILLPPLILVICAILVR